MQRSTNTQFEENLSKNIHLMPIAELGSQIIDFYCNYCTKFSFQFNALHNIVWNIIRIDWSLLSKALWSFYIAFLVSCFFDYLPAKYRDQYYVKGNELSLCLDAVTYAKKRIKAINKKLHISDFPKGLFIPPKIHLLIQADIRGELYENVSNAGKTQTLIPAILDSSWEQQPNVKICMLTIFFHENQTIILKYWGVCCIACDIGKDIRTELDVVLFEKYLINKVNGDNAVSSDVSYVVFIGFIICLQ
ncbi:hypothetical protein [Acinetobacter sp. Leaf130]|uniref:hypothetical protein n=1 Tax=Acinetobacter sp. Leaf130 TaxID=1736269 RepID=UPI0006FD01A3|nr:hypothetical protein [Acinetobacter sp. Leaf130]KQQ76748.1 hypothetical protein ASF86_04385 [Acinetobacter sp. Leaf130]